MFIQTCALRAKSVDTKVSPLEPQHDAVQRHHHFSRSNIWAVAVSPADLVKSPLIPGPVLGS